ncbi:hypothetical protein [Asticcacaulis sp. 201]|uniref:hypothetical protein n=1 Tax=Asticcacaulis sp. 201 TaxID=3028787 RepID=UPI002916DE21|nr:hypothetical protein [Asticcacaulis sp. 201]MDV6333266.1 hypothetical protein [Asticcacaulis sp. 201]
MTGEVALSVGTWRRSFIQARLTRWLDRSSPRARLAGAVTASLLLHGFLLFLLLLTPARGWLAIGTTGEGHLNGAGLAMVDLVQAVDLASLTPAASTVTEPVPVAPEVDSDAQPADATASSETTATDGLTSQPDAKTAAETTDSPTASQAQVTSAPQSAGAHGQNGTEEDALWAAIAPCWNRIADRDTLGATLKVSFSPAGGLAIPPEIERDPAVAITPQTLQSEAKAIAALAECGVYPMAQGRQDVAIVFPKR